MFGYERRLVRADEAMPGPVPARLHLLLTALIFIGLSLSLLPQLRILTPVQMGFLALLGLILARTSAVDLCHFLLLDLYTALIFFMGLASPFVMLSSHLTWYDPFIGAGIGLIFGVVLAVSAAKMRGDPVTEHIGGGDIKMFAAMGAWTGGMDFFIALSLAAFFGFGLAAFAQKNGHTPYGPALCLGLWLSVVFRDDVQVLFLQLYQSIW